MLVYVAVLKDLDSLDVMTVQTSRSRLETYINDYFGISDRTEYTYKAKYLGYTKIEYSEFEDDYEGFYSYEDDGEITKVYVFCKPLDEEV